MTTTSSVSLDSEPVSKSGSVFESEAFERSFQLGPRFNKTPGVNRSRDDFQPSSQLKAAFESYKVASNNI